MDQLGFIIGLGEKAGLSNTFLLAFGMFMFATSKIASQWIVVKKQQVEAERVKIEAEKVKTDESATYRKLLNEETAALIAAYSTQVASLRRHLDEVDAAYDKLRQRVLQLEEILRKHSIEIPPAPA